MSISLQALILTIWLELQMPRSCQYQYLLRYMAIKHTSMKSNLATCSHTHHIPMEPRGNVGRTGSSLFVKARQWRERQPRQHLSQRWLGLKRGRVHKKMAILAANMIILSGALFLDQPSCCKCCQYSDCFVAISAWTGQENLALACCGLPGRRIAGSLT